MSTKIEAYSEKLKELEVNLLDEFEHNSFDKIALKHLCQFEAFDNITQEEVLQLTLAHSIPNQFYNENQFGHFNITLINNGKFCIQVYIMNDIDTEIHDHTFDGAFRLIRGKTIHTTFEFSDRNEVEEDLFKGKLETQKALIMNTSDTHPIDTKFIHRIERLSSVNITLIITHKDPTYSERNGFVIAPHFYLKNKNNQHQLTRRLNALNYYFSIDKNEFYNYGKDFLKEIDLYSLLTCLARNNSYLTGEELDNGFKHEFLQLIKGELETRNQTYIYDDYLSFLSLRNNKKKALASF